MNQPLGKLRLLPGVRIWTLCAGFLKYVRKPDPHDSVFLSSNGRKFVPKEMAPSVAAIAIAAAVAVTKDAYWNEHTMNVSGCLFFLGRYFEVHYIMALTRCDISIVSKY